MTHIGVAVPLLTALPVILALLQRPGVQGAKRRVRLIAQAHVKRWLRIIAILHSSHSSSLHIASVMPVSTILQCFAKLLELGTLQLTDLTCMGCKIMSKVYDNPFRLRAIGFCPQSSVGLKVKTKGSRIDAEEFMQKS